jgi:hypothetical protein
VRSEANLTQVLCEWVQIVTNERPAIIEKLAAPLADRKGLKLHAEAGGRARTGVSASQDVTERSRHFTSSPFEPNR